MSDEETMLEKVKVWHSLAYELGPVLQEKFPDKKVDVFDAFLYLVGYEAASEGLPLDKLMRAVVLRVRTGFAMRQEEKAEEPR